MNGCGLVPRAKNKVFGFDELATQFSKLGSIASPAAKKAVYAAAGIVADRVRKNIEALPEDTFRKLNDGEQFSGVPKTHKIALLNNLGITPIDELDGDFINARVGFDGYLDGATKKYPNGLPAPLLANAIESGSSVRKKTPFMRPAVNATKKQALQKMAEVFDVEVKKIAKG